MKCAIVLAAGRSRRMGAQKLLLPLGETTVIAHIVDQLTASSIERVLVVVGFESERIVAALPERRVTFVENADYASGMLSSVRCGLRVLPDACEAVLVALGDQPSITTSLVDDLIRTFETVEERACGIAIPTYQGKRGHPILFAERYRSAVLSRYDDVGLRGLLQDFPEDVHELRVSEASVLSDMDDPAAYEREQRAFEECGKEQEM